MHHTSDVIIVGGGPVGTALAIELATRGIEVIVLERHFEPQAVPKGQNLTQRTVEHFKRWGIEHALHDARTRRDDQPAVGLVAYGDLQSEHHYAWMQRDRVGAFYAATNERLPQYVTESVLRERLTELPTATAEYGWRAEQITAGDDGVEVVAVDRAGTQRTYRAGWVVGCDGAKSPVREAAGITQTFADHDRRMVLTVFRSPEFDELMTALPPASFVSVLHPDFEGYWQFFGRVDATETWFFHAPVSADTTAESLQLGEVLRRAAGASFEFEAEYIGFWDLRFALADTYRAGRILIAGDAAHSHPPYGGYGINTGFEDAANLGWKLAAEIHGWAGPGLLDSYDAERRPIFASTRDEFIDRSIRNDREFLARYSPSADLDAFRAAWAARADAAKSEVGAFEPHYEGSPVIPGTSGTPSAKGVHRHEARPGHHLAPGTTADDDPVFDALGKEFTLLLADGAPGTDLEAAAARLGVPLRTVRLAAASVDSYAAEAILVRPDGFVAWAGRPDDADARTVLAQAVGAAAPMTTTPH